MTLSMNHMKTQLPLLVWEDDFFKNTIDNLAVTTDGARSSATFSDKDLLKKGVAANTLADPDYVKQELSFRVEVFDAKFFIFQWEAVGLICNVYCESAIHWNCRLCLKI